MAKPQTLSPQDPSVSLEEGLEAYDFEEVVLGTLESDGIPLAKRPVDLDGNPVDVTLPPNLSEQSNDALGDLMGQLSQMIGYLTGRYRYYDSQLDTAKRRRKLAFAVIKKEKEGIPSERSDETTIDERFVEEDVKVAVLEEIVALTKAAVEAKEQDYAAVSRFVSLREKGGRRGSRDQSVGRGRGRSFRS